MKLSEAHRNFKIEADKLDIVSIASFLPEEIDYFLNTAIQRIIKTRYSGLNVHKSGFQQSQKRSDDLRTVVKTSVISPTFTMYDSTIAYAANAVVYYVGHLYKSITGSTGEVPDDDPFWIKLNSEQNRFEFEYPEDYWIGLGEKCSISKVVAPTTIGGPSSLTAIGTVDIIESTIENIDARLNSSLSEHIFHNGKARPIRLYADNKIYIYTDSNYLVNSYSITYIAKPEKVDTYAYPVFSSANSYAIGDKVISGGKQYICIATDSAPSALTSFEEIDITTIPDHMWDEVIVNAVRYALENISENRYQTYSQESQLVE